MLINITVYEQSCCYIGLKRIIPQAPERVQNVCTWTMYIWITWRCIALPTAIFSYDIGLLCLICKITFQSSLKLVFILLSPICQLITSVIVSPHLKQGWHPSTLTCTCIQYCTGDDHWQLTCEHHITHSYIQRRASPEMWRKSYYRPYISITDWCNSTHLYVWNAFFDDASLSNAALACREHWWKLRQGVKVTAEISAYIFNANFACLCHRTHIIQG